MKKRVAVLIVFMIAISLLSGCGRIIKTKDGSVSVKNGNLEIKGKDGEKTTIQTGDSKKGGSLPDKYPKDLVPLIDGAKIILASKSTQNDKAQFSVMYECKKDMKEVGEYYKKLMEGTEENNTMESDELIILSGEKDKYKISIAVTTQSNNDKEYKSAVTIGIEEK